MNQYIIRGLNKYLNFIKLIMKKDINVNMYSNLDKKKTLFYYSTYIGGMLKSSIKTKIDDKRKYDSSFHYNVELNFFENNKNVVEVDASEIFTKKIIKFNFCCTYKMLDYITTEIIIPFGKQFKTTVEEYEKTHKCHSGYMLQPPEKSDPNYKELMKEYWKEYNYLHS